ncbi:hypothetical protein QVD17_21289 [Tagetes erecta]|uniref:Secreted protein n=1 Tax=Tagetes erecta TaxID=13708 RepID=A0AAD8NRS9_TARER|nr:hypothetical protein QVD17_21289 [Tagetes erecta]
MILVVLWLLVLFMYDVCIDESNVSLGEESVITHHMTGQAAWPHGACLCKVYLCFICGFSEFLPLNVVGIRGYNQERGGRTGDGVVGLMKVVAGVGKEKKSVWILESSEDDDAAGAVLTNSNSSAIR